MEKSKPSARIAESFIATDESVRQCTVSANVHDVRREMDELHERIESLEKNNAELLVLIRNCGFKPEAEQPKCRHNTEKTYWTTAHGNFSRKDCYETCPYCPDKPKEKTLAEVLVINYEDWTSLNKKEDICKRMAEAVKEHFARMIEEAHKEWWDQVGRTRDSASTIKFEDILKKRLEDL